MAGSKDTHSKLKELSIRIAGYVSIFILSSLLIMVVLGDSFFGIPSALGMRNWISNPGGVFADCADPTYRKRNKFCNKKYTGLEENWNDIGNSGDSFVPF